MKNFIYEFRQFIMRGSVIDLAVGVIIGGALQKIVSSIISDLVLPAISPLLGVVEFSRLKLWVFNVGNLFEATLNFMIIALCVFLLVKSVNGFRSKMTKSKNPYMTTQEKLLIEIRDLLKKDI